MKHTTEKSLTGYFRDNNNWYLWMMIWLFIVSCKINKKEYDDIAQYAGSRKNDLVLSVYITAQAVDRLLTSVEGRREAVSILRANGITRVYLEVYRGGDVVPNVVLKEVSDHFKQNGFEVAAGIATVPGKDFGVPQEGRYGWFNWQNEKTQKDLANLMAETAPLFKSFIVDDFVCTSDTSQESKFAKGKLSWSQYRRDLLVNLSEKLFIDAPKKTNPSITMIIKYPQWYDRYHLFGYDVARQPDLFDQVWIGTETRGPYTQRFGFVQAYEGFINYRWMASLSGNKMGGAWFDHIDCTAVDFLDQAYQSVLGGARELIIFNYFNFTEGHPGQHLLRLHFHHLADLASIIATNPVFGPASYKPANSDAGGDLYIMDFIGMLGIPLIPYSRFPENTDVLFLPTQAAADTAIMAKINNALSNGTRIIITSGFLAHLPDGGELAGKAGIGWPVIPTILTTNTLVQNNVPVPMDSVLRLESDLILSGATAELEVLINGKFVPFLTRNPEGNIYVWNSHTFSEEDFIAAGEGLLCPGPVGLLDIPAEWADKIRDVFNKNIPAINAPARVTLQPFGKDHLMIQNYNQQPVQVRIRLTEGRNYTEVFSGKDYHASSSDILLDLEARGRIWLRPE